MMGAVSSYHLNFVTIGAATPGRRTPGCGTLAMLA